MKLALLVAFAIGATVFVFLEVEGRWKKSGAMILVLLATAGLMRHLEKRPTADPSRAEN